MAQVAILALKSPIGSSIRSCFGPILRSEIGRCSQGGCFGSDITVLFWFIKGRNGAGCYFGSKESNRVFQGVILAFM